MGRSVGMVIQPITAQDMRLIRYIWPNTHVRPSRSSIPACSPDSYGRSALSVTLGASFRETPLTRNRQLVRVRGRRLGSAGQEAPQPRPDRAGRAFAGFVGRPPPVLGLARLEIARAWRLRPSPPRRPGSTHRARPESPAA